MNQAVLLPRQWPVLLSGLLLDALHGVVSRPVEAFRQVMLTDDGYMNVDSSGLGGFDHEDAGAESVLEPGSQKILEQAERLVVGAEAASWGRVKGDREHSGVPPAAGWGAIIDSMFWPMTAARRQA